MDIEKLIRTALPKSKGEYSRDAVEALMRLAFEAGSESGHKQSARQAAEDERERIHGPYSI